MAIIFNNEGTRPMLEMLFQIKSVGLPEPVAEFKFDEGRRWRFDYCWPSQKVALEIEGGLFARKGAHRCRTCNQMPRGRHATAEGLKNDLEKYNKAAELGYRLVRVTPQMVSNGEALAIIEKVLR